MEFKEGHAKELAEAARSGVLPSDEEDGVFEEGDEEEGEYFEEQDLEESKQRFEMIVMEALLSTCEEDGLPLLDRRLPDRSILEYLRVKS